MKLEIRRSKFVVTSSFAAICLAVISSGANARSVASASSHLEYNGAPYFTESLMGLQPVLNSPEYVNADLNQNISVIGDIGYTAKFRDVFDKLVVLGNVIDEASGMDVEFSRICYKSGSVINSYVNVSIIKPTAQPNMGERLQVLIGAHANAVQNGQGRYDAAKAGAKYYGSVSSDIVHVSTVNGRLVQQPGPTYTVIRNSNRLNSAAQGKAADQYNFFYGLSCNNVQ